MFSRSEHNRQWHRFDRGHSLVQNGSIRRWYVFTGAPLFLHVIDHSTRLDEVSALVLDIGSSTLRAGYAGDDTPKAIIPSSYGFVPVSRDADVSMTDAGAETEPALPREESKLFIGQHGPSVWREEMQIGNPMSEGLSA